MKIVTIEVDPKFVPEGYEAVAYRVPVNGDQYLMGYEIMECPKRESLYPWLIIRPVRQWHQVTEENVVDVLKNWEKYDFRALGIIPYTDIVISTAPDHPPYVFMTHDGLCFGYWGTGLQGSGRNTVAVHRLQYSPKP